mmetsp:Transcript_37595/g.87969  ORF Transcript_37595/g.87969 Transcript_37595/m.87969 type:complete len:91 (+) Transcript_37595:86-358(+)
MCDGVCFSFSSALLNIVLCDLCVRVCVCVERVSDCRPLLHSLSLQYCNALENWEPLSEGADGDHRVYHITPPVDPNTVDPWLSSIGKGIY